MASDNVKEERLIESVLAVSNERKTEILGTHDQVTGKGLPRHDYRMQLVGYPIADQYLTDDVYNHPLYSSVREKKGLKRYVQWFNKSYGKQLSEPLTVEMLIIELMVIRIALDPYFAFAVCFHIKDKRSGKMVPFNLNYAQIRMLEMLEDMRRHFVPIRLILLKARQWGGSTLVQLYIDWIQMFIRTGWNSIILAQTKDTSRRIKGMFHKVVENMPDFIFGPSLKFSPYESSQSDFILTDSHGKPVRDNVTTVSSYENFESTRGADFAMAHFSEVAFWRTTPGKSAEQLITNIAGGMGPYPDTLEVLESTANGQSGFFYDEYQLAKKGKSIRKSLFVPFMWIEHDMLEFADEAERIEFATWLVRNRFSTEETETTDSGVYNWSLWNKGATLEHLKWYILKRASFHDHASMAQEAPSDDEECFKFSGIHVFSPYRIAELREMYVKEPIWKGEITRSNNRIHLSQSDTGQLWIWQHAEKSDLANDYLVVVDPGGRSKDADPSCITVISRKALVFSGGKPEVVARWHGHIRYDQLAWKAVHIAMLYNNAKLVFESNTMDKKKAEAGEFVEQGDHIRGILNVISDTYKNLYVRPATDPEDLKKGIMTKIGFHTNVKTKQDMVDNFIVVFEDDMWIDPDERLYHEASIYEQFPDGHYGNHEGRGNHDDILMTDMIGALVSASMPKPMKRHPDVYETRSGGTANESRI